MTRMSKSLQLAITLVLLGAILVGGCGDRPKGNDRSGIKITDPDMQKDELRSRIERNYSDAQAHYSLGKLHFEDGLWQRAEWEFNVALSFEPMHTPSQAAIVKTLLASSQNGRAKLAAEMYINQASTSAQNSFLLGQSFQKELLDDYAVMCYQQALGLAPKSAVIHKQIGYYYLSKADAVRAEEYLRRSFQIDPYQPEVAGQLGRLGVKIQVPRKEPKSAKSLDKRLIKEQKKIGQP